MKQRLLLLLSVILLFSCAKETFFDTPIEAQNSTNLLTNNEINQEIYTQLKQKGEFKWDENDIKFAWSALVNSDNVLAIGYQPAEFKDIESKLGFIDINTSEWVSAKEEIIDIIIQTLRLTDPTLVKEDFLLKEESKHLPIFYIKTKSLILLEKLRNMPTVRYAEPMGYDMDASSASDRSSSGCGSNNSNYNIPSADYQTWYPNSKISWHLFDANIPAAWTRSTGNNIGVCLIDTGTSPNQSKLNGSFNNGLSQGRYISRLGTYVSSWWWWASPDGPDDGCGHGTSMAGLIAGPRGWNGSASGVAYNCNMVAIRGTSDVFLSNSREKNGVKDALVMAGNRSDVNIISMSIGTPFWSSTVADGVYYAYNHGKMIFAAAGTSTTFTTWAGVIFPARMSQCTAVTGIKDDNNYNHCSTCHYGSEVEFSIVMQRASNNDRTALTLAMSGNQPSTVGGSSAATATTAGIAALVWATNPNMSRSTVKNRMINAAELGNNPDSDYGYGRINAAAAVDNNPY